MAVVQEWGPAGGLREEEGPERIGQQEGVERRKGPIIPVREFSVEVFRRL